MRYTIIISLIFVLSACAHPMTRESGTGQGIHDALEQAQRDQVAGAPPEEVTRALLPEARGAGALAAVPEQRFDINVDGAGARGFFTGLVRGTPYNIVIHPDVTGTISLNLKNVTVAEVMEIVRDVYGYEYRTRQDGFLVLPVQLRNAVFEVNYLDVRRTGESRTRVSSGQATESPQVQTGALGGGGLGARGATQQQEDMSGSMVETRTDSDFWETLQQTLVAMVGNEDGRGVVVNRLTGTIVVRAMPVELREVADYLDSVQASAQRQVILEAKVIEVELRDGYETGINWTAIARRGSRTVTGGVVRGNDLFSDGRSALHGRAVLGGAPPSFASEAFGGVMGLAVDTRDFEAFIELLETQGRTQVLSSPRTTAINNQKSVIKVGTDEFFFTGIQALATTAGTGATTSRNVQVAPFFSGIALDVTPQISADGDVILHIHPSVSDVTDQTKTFTMEGQEDTMPLARSTIRESDSIVRARSGEVIVIGGLMRTFTRDEVAGTPGLSRVPVVGGLFRQTQQVEVKSELVILLRPIVVGDDTWTQLLREQQQRTGTMSPRSGW